MKERSTFSISCSLVPHQRKGVCSAFLLFIHFDSHKIFTESMFLGPPDSYNYLNQSGCYDVQGMDDAKEFNDMKAACNVMNIVDEDQQAIFRVISGILHLGNIVFTQSYPYSLPPPPPRPTLTTAYIW